MKAVDPTHYRHFLVKGELIVNGEPAWVFMPAHADDLPAGEEGKQELAERVRRCIGADMGDPAAQWGNFSVTEFAPPSEMYELEPGDTW